MIEDKGLPDRGFTINSPSTVETMLAVLDSDHLKGHVLLIGAGVGKSALIHHMLEKERGLEIIDIADMKLKETKHEIIQITKRHDLFPLFAGDLDRSQFTKPIIRDTPRISRNSQCTCNSGKKYKRCCGKDI